MPTKQEINSLIGGCSKQITMFLKVLLFPSGVVCLFFALQIDRQPVNRKLKTAIKSVHKTSSPCEQRVSVFQFF